jgi:hypothetical protein
MHLFRAMRYLFHFSAIKNRWLLVLLMACGHTAFAQTHFFYFVDSLFQKHEISDCAMLKEQLQNAGYKMSGNDALDKLVTRLMYMHLLLTSYYSVDGDTSGGFGIPYFWNYTNHNPRLTILNVRKGKMLGQIPQPGGAAGSSMATLDRTPVIFWGDFMTDLPQYSWNHISGFYTFGWCSEREMAFKAWIGLLGIPATISIHTDHVWTEVELPAMPGYYIFIDNTFNRFEVRPVSKRDKPDAGNKYINWYNQQGADKAIQKKMAAMTISKKRAAQLEHEIRTYFNSNTEDY